MFICIVGIVQLKRLHSSRQKPLLDFLPQIDKIVLYNSFKLTSKRSKIHYLICIGFVNQSNVVDWPNEVRWCLSVGHFACLSICVYIKPKSLRTSSYILWYSVNTGKALCDFNYSTFDIMAEQHKSIDFISLNNWNIFNMV